MPIRLSRRELLCGVSALALVPLLSGQTHGTTASSFGGNPNVTITAIDTSGGIVLSRSNGQTPAFVQTSASAITATGTDWPYEDLAYRWNFGDPTGTETFTNPVTGGAVNANSDQTGPEAAYVYRTAGTKTITLYIQGKNGSGFTNSVVTTTFTVTAFSPAHEYWVDTNAAPGGNGTQGSPYNLIRSLSGKSLINTRFNIARGSVSLNSIDSGGYISISGAAGLRIQAYGSGADPIIKFDSDNTRNPTRFLSPIAADNGSGGTGIGTPLSDVVVSNIRSIIGASCTNTNAAVAINGYNAHLGGGDGTFSNIYFDKCTMESQSSHTVDTVNFGTDNRSWPSWNAGFWNCTVTNPLADGSANRQGIAAQSWNNNFFFVGGYIEGAGSVPNRDHHIYPIIKTHGLFRWIDFGPSNSNFRVYCVNEDWNNMTVGGFSSCSIDDGAGGSGTILTVGGTPSSAAFFFVPGNVITGVGVTAGTTIVSHISGNGRAGTKYNVDRASLVTPGEQILLVFALQYSEYLVYDGNHFFGTQASHDADDGNNDPTKVQWRNQVCQNCAFDSLTLAGTLASAVISYTARDNNAWGIGANSLFYLDIGATIAPHMAFKFYRNKIYQTSSSTFACNTAGAALTSPQPLVFTDNIIYDTRATPTILNVKAADMENCIIDRNQYYAPNSGSGGTRFNKNNGASALTFLAWQALGANFDPHSTIGNPNWIDPAHGNFNT